MESTTDNSPNEVNQLLSQFGFDDESAPPAGIAVSTNAPVTPTIPTSTGPNTTADASALNSLATGLAENFSRIINNSIIDSRKGDAAIIAEITKLTNVVLSVKNELVIIRQRLDSIETGNEKIAAAARAKKTIVLTTNTAGEFDPNANLFGK